MGLAAFHDTLAWLPALAAMLGAVLIQIGTNFANDYYDFMRGGDTEERVGPVRVTQAGLLPPRSVHRGMVVVLTAAVLVGAYLVFVAGWPIVWIGLASVACAVLYTGGPFPLAYHGLGDVFVFLFFGLIAITGVVGNLLVIIVVVSNKRMRNTTNLLIINLAFADLLFIIVCVPFTATVYAMSNWPFGLVWCKIYQYIVNVTAYASVYTLVGMSLDRYLAVVHPFQSMTIRTERNAYIVIGALWACILLGNVIIAFDHGIMEYDFLGEHRSACLYLHIQTSRAKVYYGVFFALAYVVPLFTVCILYGFMLNRLLYRVVPGGSQSSESMRQKKRVTYMIIVVVVIFAVCWLPIQVIFLLLYVFDNYPSGAGYTAFKLFTTCLAYMNSCVDPVLYAFLSENFRKSFRKLLCCYSGFQPVHLDIERTNARALEHNTKTTALNGNNGI